MALGSSDLSHRNREQSVPFSDHHLNPGAPSWKKVEISEKKVQSGWVGQASGAFSILLLLELSKNHNKPAKVVSPNY